MTVSESETAVLPSIVPKTVMHMFELPAVRPQLNPFASERAQKSILSPSENYSVGQVQSEVGLIVILHCGFTFSLHVLHSFVTAAVAYVMYQVPYASLFNS